MKTFSLIFLTACVLYETFIYTICDDLGIIRGSSEKQFRGFKRLSTGISSCSLFLIKSKLVFPLKTLRINTKSCIVHL